MSPGSKLETNILFDDDDGFDVSNMLYLSCILYLSQSSFAFLQ
jgi:hypothetical protein